MDATVYILYSLLCFLVYFMSYFAPRDESVRLLKVISGFLLIGLGVFSLTITFIFNLSLSITTYTYNSENWQVALFVVFSLLGLTNFLFGVFWPPDRRED